MCTRGDYHKDSLYAATEVTRAHGLITTTLVLEGLQKYLVALEARVPVVCEACGGTGYTPRGKHYEGLCVQCINGATWKDGE